MVDRARWQDLPTVVKKLWQKVDVNVHQDVKNVPILHGGDGGLEVLGCVCTLDDGRYPLGLE